MGGDLDVQSTEGRGSTFAFQCPLPLANVTAPSRSPVRVPDVLRGKRVLLVDDNSVNRLVGRALLLKAGVDVTIAEDGEHALVEVCNAAAPFDAVLMDVQMPVMDGYQATAEIRRRLGERTPPIVAVTAHAMVEQRAESLAAGMVAHVTKPIDPAELYGVLERLFSAS
jgi:CheY-like chemotaxis protein